MTLAVPTETRASRTGRTPRRLDVGSAARTAIGLVVVIVLWELLARTVLGGTNVIAPPSGIAAAIRDNWSLYQRATRTTLWEAARGFVWGNAAALVLAGIVAVAPITERVVLRVALAVFCLPLVAMGPLLRVVYGTGDGPQVTLAALAVFYTTLVPVIVGLRAVPAVVVRPRRQLRAGSLPDAHRRSGPGPACRTSSPASRSPRRPPSSAPSSASSPAPSVASAC